MYQTFARFCGRGFQKFAGHFGLIRKLRDVECAGPFCFKKIEKKVRKIDIEISKIEIIIIKFVKYNKQFVNPKPKITYAHLN